MIWSKYFLIWIQLIFSDLIPASNNSGLFFKVTNIETIFLHSSIFWWSPEINISGTFLELISKSKHRKVEFFTYVDDIADDKTSVDFNPEDQFNVIDIFKSFIKSRDYSQTFKTDLARKFIEVHGLVKQERGDE